MEMSTLSSGRIKKFLRKNGSIFNQIMPKRTGLVFPLIVYYNWSVTVPNRSDGL